ncbi:MULTISPECIES: Hsp20/alpha crystallin family protein [unclassified Haladaptatus]|uniref:Hsp20/alpha crystallin family protein n=1 Tax=unclassified Haladaptatus TaxID=2622732 RepID=UPI002FCE021F
MSALRDALRDLPDAVFADLLENDDSYLLVIDFPGVTKDTVDVRVENGRLHIEARREKDLPTEYRYLREDRSMFLDVDLPLPPKVTGTEAEGSVSRGVLEITLPKWRAAPGTSIPISDE